MHARVLNESGEVHAISPISHDMDVCDGSGSKHCFSSCFWNDLSSEIEVTFSDRANGCTDLDPYWSITCNGMGLIH